MTPDNDPPRMLREQAAALATAVNGMSERISDLSRGLSSLQKYGRRNRMMIIAAIISLAIELFLVAALAVISSNIINSNHRINCFTNAITKALPERSAFFDTSMAVENLKSAALAKEVSAQASSSSAAERQAAQAQYLADIVTINRIPIPPLPVFNPHC